MSALSPLLPSTLVHLDSEYGDTCTFHRIKAWMGCTGSESRVSDARFAEFLTELIGTSQFPKPLPSPRHGGGIERGVTPRSKWLKAGVLQWLSGYLPPDAADAIDTQALEQAARDMDAAAARLATPTTLRLAASNGERA